MAEDRDHKHESESSNRGFGSMDERKHQDAASKGGQSVPADERSFSKDRQLASEAGRKGGETKGTPGGSHQESSRSDKKEHEENDRSRGGTGNFAHDRERASEAGRKGGQH